MIKFDKGFFNKNLCKSQRYTGFTLAEVLVTLGIIGVVAAITIPTLIKNHQKQETVSRLKSTYTILNNAINMAKVDNGNDVNTWPVPNTSNKDITTYFAQTYLLPYLQTSKICGTSTSVDCILKEGLLSNLTSSTKSFYTMSGNSNDYCLQLKNGAVVCVSSIGSLGSIVSDVRIWIVIDINGFDKPNIVGLDTFVVELGGGGGASDKNKILPYGLPSDRNWLVSGDAVACNKVSGNGFACFALIMIDGWQIGDNYPWN